VLRALLEEGLRELPQAMTAYVSARMHTWQTSATSLSPPPPSKTSPRAAAAAPTRLQGLQVMLTCAWRMPAHAGVWLDRMLTSAATPTHRAGFAGRRGERRCCGRLGADTSLPTLALLPRARGGASVGAWGGWRGPGKARRSRRRRRRRMRPRLP
jgi:hypothetical protein